MPFVLAHPFSLPPRWRAAALLAAAVVGLHAALLLARPTPASTAKARSAAPALTVRTVLLTTPASALAGAPSAAPTRPPPRAPARPPVSVNGEGAAASTEPTAAVPDANPASIPALIPASIPADQPPATTRESNDGLDLPQYATQPPAATTLHFEVRRGSQSGQAVLAWRPGDTAYVLTLDSSAFGVQALGSASQGSFDAAGLAPDRFVDKRRGREVRATNFQRQANLISFSGPPQTLPLWPGSQDRLSWMLQLPAIVQANPALAAPGAQVQMRVVGSRGEADVWVFTLLGLEDLQLPAGEVRAALRWQRLPRRPYDTLVEIWLDPARQHLPVRARLGIKPSGESTEFLLQRLE